MSRKNIFYKIIFFLSCTTFFISCDDDNIDNVSPRDFEIVQVGEFHDKIHLRWTESTDPENSIVSYDIYIKEDIADASYRLVKGNLTEFDFGRNGSYIRPNGSLYIIDQPDPRYVYSYPILNLEDDKNWMIKITAKDQEGNSKDIVIKMSTIFFPPLPNFVGVWKGTYNGPCRADIWNWEPSEKTGELVFTISRRDDFITYDFNHDVDFFHEEQLGSSFDPSTGELTLKLMDLFSNGGTFLDDIYGVFPEEGNTVEGVMMYNGEVTGSWSAIKQE